MEARLVKEDARDDDRSGGAVEGGQEGDEMQLLLRSNTIWHHNLQRTASVRVQHSPPPPLL